jgi:Zn-finger nucleic acid-binding protein
MTDKAKCFFCGVELDRPKSNNHGMDVDRCDDCQKIIADSGHTDWIPSCVIKRDSTSRGIAYGTDGFLPVHIVPREKPVKQLELIA